MPDYNHKRYDKLVRHVHGGVRPAVSVRWHLVDYSAKFYDYIAGVGGRRIHFNSVKVRGAVGVVSTDSSTLKFG